jgi:ATP-binding cassette subfamily B multidrug efflux pump
MYLTYDLRLVTYDYFILYFCNEVKSLKTINKYFLKYKWLVLWGAVFIFLSNYFSVYPAQAIRDAIDAVTNYVSKEETGNGIYIQVFWYTGAIIGFSLLRGIFMFFMRQTIIVMSRRIENDMKNEIFHHYQLLSTSFYKQNNTGDLMNRISEDVSRVRMYTGPAIMYALNTLFTFILVIGAMFRVNAVLTWYVILPLPLLSVLMYFVNDIIHKKSEAIQEQLSSLTSFVQESISGIRLVKAFAREGAMQGQMQDQIIDYRTRQLSLAKTDALYFPVNLLLIGLSTLITIYIGGIQYINGKGTLGNIAEFVFYVNMLTWPVSSIGWVTAIIQRAAASQKRINEFLHTQPHIESGTINDFEFKQEIVLENVSFTYADSGIMALKNIDLKLQKGKVIGVTGATGSGKTSLAQLLLRIYNPGSGAIRADGMPIEMYNVQNYRKQFGYVPQDVFLFSDSIKNNIAFADEYNIHKDTVVDSARKAAVYENIMEFDKQFETSIGERGITLSGGQKQRISIARALAKNPSILIFDDCLSAVDSTTEKEILYALKQVIKDKTALIISHRVSSVQLADEIIVLHEGAIIERGTHEFLIGNEGYYAAMYAKQQQEEVPLENKP